MPVPELICHFDEGFRNSLGKRNFFPGSCNTLNMAGCENGLISQRHGWWSEGQGIVHTPEAVFGEGGDEGWMIHSSSHIDVFAQVP